MGPCVIWSFHMMRMQCQVLAHVALSHMVARLVAMYMREIGLK